MASKIDAIALLKADHRKVEDLFAKFEKTKAADRKQRLAQEICTELTVHTLIEEEIFYPAFKEAGRKEEAKMYYEALEEHRAAGDLVLPDLLSADEGSEVFSGRAKVLKELIEHHADEEEKEMFKDAKTLMSKQQLNELGAQMEQRKQQILDELS